MCIVSITLPTIYLAWTEYRDAFGLFMTVSTNSIPFLRTYGVVKYLAVGSECFSKAELALTNVPNEARQGVSQLNLPSRPLSNPATSSWSWK